MNKNKSVLITGGAQRIGKSIALHLAKKKWNLAIQYNRSEDDIKKLKNQVKGYRIKFNSYKFDFGKTFYKLWK